MHLHVHVHVHVQCIIDLAYIFIHTLRAYIKVELYCNIIYYTAIESLQDQLDAERDDAQAKLEVEGGH